MVLPKLLRRFIYSFLPFEEYNKALKLSKFEREMVLSEKPYRTFEFRCLKNLEYKIPEKELKTLLHKIAMRVDVDLDLRADMRINNVC